MNAFNYFNSSDLVIKKKYDALKDFYFHKKKAVQVANEYGYTLSSFYSLTRDFNRYLACREKDDFFFISKKAGRKHIDDVNADELIISLRKQNLSTDDILTILHGKGYKLSYQYVYQLLKNEGFAKLERRNQQQKQQLICPKLKAEKSKHLQFTNEKFSTQNVSLLCFRVLIEEYKITELINNSSYPETKTINRLSSILSFVALKLSNVRR